MTENFKIKKNEEFKSVYEKKISCANKYLIMYVKKNESGITRRGISVSKKVGNSVVRHRITRLIREAFRLHKEDVKEGYDMVIIARPAAKGQGYFVIESAYLHLLKLHNIKKVCSQELK